MKYIALISLLLASTIASADLPVNLTQGMNYESARKQLLKDHWQTEDRAARAIDQSMAEATMCGTSNEFSDKMCRAFPEYDGCGHVCDMYFTDATNNKRLRVMTDHNDHPKGKLTGKVKGWEFDDGQEF